MRKVNDLFHKIGGFQLVKDKINIYDIKNSLKYKVFEENNMYQLPKREFVLFYILGGFMSSIIGYLFYKNFYIAFLFFLSPLLFYKKYKRRMIEKRKEHLNYGFKDALYGMSASIAAGRSLEEAIIDTCGNLKRLYREESLIYQQFLIMKKRIWYTNEPPEQVLMEFGIKSELEDIRNFAEVCSICIKTGGDLNYAIVKAVGIITDKINLRKELTVLTAQKKLEVKLLTLIPLIVLAFMQLTSANYMSVLYETTLGNIIMSICLCTILGAFILGERITEIEI